MCGHKGEPRNAVGAGFPLRCHAGGPRGSAVLILLLSVPRLRRGRTPLCPPRRLGPGRNTPRKRLEGVKRKWAFAPSDVSAGGAWNGLLRPRQPRLQNRPAGVLKKPQTHTHAPKIKINHTLRAISCNCSSIPVHLLLAKELKTNLRVCKLGAARLQFSPQWFKRHPTSWRGTQETRQPQVQKSRVTMEPSAAASPRAGLQSAGRRQEPLSSTKGEGATVAA